MAYTKDASLENPKTALDLAAQAAALEASKVLSNHALDASFSARASVKSRPLPEVALQKAKPCYEDGC